MRFIILVFGVLSHLTAGVPNAAADARFGQLVGIEMSASAYDDEVHPCRI